MVLGSTASSRGCAQFGGAVGRLRPGPSGHDREAYAARCHIGLEMLRFSEP